MAPPQSEPSGLVQLCEKCTSMFSGRLWRFRERGGGYYLVESLPDLRVRDGGDCIQWKDLSERISQGPNMSTGKRVLGWKAMPSNTKIMYHHTLEGLVASADQGCYVCQLFIRGKDHESTTSALKDSNGVPIRALPVVTDSTELPESSNQTARISLWFLQDTVADSASIPFAKRLFSSIDLSGPVSDPAARLAGQLPDTTAEALRSWMNRCLGHRHNNYNSSGGEFKSYERQQAGHSLCRSRMVSFHRHFTAAPRRLLHLETKHKSMLWQTAVQLIEVDTDVWYRASDTYSFDDAFIGQPPRYATLSHRWGDKAMVGKLTTENYDAYIRGIDLKRLPKTFVEAVNVTVALGIKFLWIDALCIVQDSKQDWEREAPRMGSIYGNAFVNLAATGASDGDEGLFPPEPPTVHAKWQIERGGTQDFDAEMRAGHYYLQPSADSVTSPIPLSTIPISNPSPSYPRPLDSRAWVMQERLLSICVIEFHRDGVRWFCGMGGYDERDDAYSGDGGRPRRSAVLKRADEAIGKSRWDVIVQEYMARHLTFTSDRLVAISAVAQLIAKYRHHAGTSELRYGLWQENMAREVLWYLKVPVEGMRMVGGTNRSAGSGAASNGDDDLETSNSETLFPSWSWASLPNLPHPNQFRGRNPAYGAVEEEAVQLSGRHRARNPHIRGRLIDNFDDKPAPKRIHSGELQGRLGGPFLQCDFRAWERAHLSFPRLAAAYGPDKLLALRCLLYRVALYRKADKTYAALQGVGDLRASYFPDYGVDDIPVERSEDASAEQKQDEDERKKHSQVNGEDQTEKDEEEEDEMTKARERAKLPILLNTGWIPVIAYRFRDELWMDGLVVRPLGRRWDEMRRLDRKGKGKEREGGGSGREAEGDGNADGEKWEPWIFTRVGVAVIRVRRPGAPRSGSHVHERRFEPGQFPDFFAIGDGVRKYPDPTTIVVV